ncbi:MAG: arsenite methyltransferase [Solirubrobacteraceae bacterium]|nr:arsenite methyltransferase [Solirubrobacteraceae bacterium]
MTLEFNEATARALEAIYGTRDVLRRRRLVQEAIGASPGERILDVGCGPGFYVAELLERVGPGGQVCGADTSAPMLAIAARRAAPHDNVELVEAPATALPFDSGSFDGAISVQVLEYIDDVAAALAELHRVLRPGGRVVIWDVDWETVSMATEDPARLERVLAAWDRHLVHRALPQTLGRDLRAAGFTAVELTGHSFTTGELTREAYGGSMIGIMDNYLAGHPDVSDADRTGWLEEQRALGAAGAFYFACVQCCCAATRPG